MASEVVSLGLMEEVAEEEGGTQRRFPPYARLLISALAGPGMPLASLPYLAEKYLDVSWQSQGSFCGQSLVEVSTWVGVGQSRRRGTAHACAWHSRGMHAQWGSWA